MADDEKHTIRNLIVFPIIAGLILAGLLYFIPKLWAFVTSMISKVWKYLFSSTSLPNSLLILLVILAIPTIISITKYFFRKKGESISSETSIKSYTTDNLFGMIWKWSFINENDMPSHDLWCFCPGCATRLVYSDSHTFSDRETFFKCENCNFHSNVFKGSKDDALSRVARQIERRVATGEWKDTVKRSSNNSV